jgi:hypothetical protein
MHNATSVRTAHPTPPRRAHHMVATLRRVTRGRLGRAHPIHAERRP